MLNQRRKSDRAAMTLVEIMLVLFILMSIATVGIFAVRGFSEQAKKNRAKIAIGEYARGLESFYTMYGRFPTTEEGLNALRYCPADIDQTDYEPLIKTEVQLDPWGMPYNYQWPSQRDRDFDLWSSGPDMTSGTADDITN